MSPLPNPPVPGIISHINSNEHLELRIEETRHPSMLGIISDIFLPHSLDLSRNLDALPAAGHVTIDVLRHALRGGKVVARIIHDGDALVVRIERRGSKIGHATSPHDGTLGGIRTAGNPRA